MPPTTSQRYDNSFLNTVPIFTLYLSREEEAKALQIACAKVH